MGNGYGSKEFDELAPYLTGVRQRRPLSREDERALAIRARGGDLAARQMLVHHNLTLAVAVARRQRRNGVRLDDLIQEGNIGLMRAADRFDPSYGTRFATYAAWWIRAYVGKYLKEARSAVRPQGGAVAQPDVPLDADDEELDAAHQERLRADLSSPEDLYLAAEGSHGVRRALARVRRRVGEVGWDIIHSRLAQDQPRTLEEIAKQWRVSRERVRQIEMRTRHVLSHHLSDPGDADAAA